MKFFKKSYTYAACFGLLLTSSFSYSMLKTFVLSDAIQTVKATTTDTKAAKKAAASATTTDTSYSDDNIQVTLTEKTVENTQVYIADITVSSSDYLKTAFAQNTYGTNVTAKTSVTAAMVTITELTVQDTSSEMEWSTAIPFGKIQAMVT